MLKERLKKLSKIYFVIAIFAVLGCFCFNTFADDISLNIDSENMIYEGKIVKAGDWIKKADNYYKVYYFDNNESELKRDLDGRPDGYVIEKIGDYSIWQVKQLKYYLGSLLELVLIPSALDGPDDQSVTMGMPANFSVDASKNIGDNLTYEWYQVNKIKNKVDSSNVTNENNYNVFEPSTDINGITSYSGNGKTLIVKIPADAISFTFDYSYIQDGYVSVWARDLDSGIYIDQSYSKTGTETIYLKNRKGNKLSNDYYTIEVSTCYFYMNSQKATVGNFTYEVESDVKLDSTTKNLTVSSTQNSTSYKDKNEFYAIVNNGSKTYQSKTAKLNIVEGKETFETDKGNITLDKELPINYKLKIFNITSKVQKNIINKINENLADKNETVNVFNVGMYKNDELIDIGEGKYLLNIEKPEELKEYTDIKISELDKDFNIIKTEEPKDDNTGFSFTVNKLNNFAISGKKITNPITKSPFIVIISLIATITILTIVIVKYRKNDIDEEII